MWRGWVLLGGAIVLGVLAGAVATVWVSGPAAAAVGSVIAAAVFGVVSARGKALLEQRAEQRDVLPSHVFAAAGSGRLRRVRELDDPIALGVHPAEMVTRVMGGQIITDRVPPYVPRDVQQQLRELVAGGGFILLVGDSTAGKTRAAYEAVRALLPDHVLVAPAGRQSLSAIVSAVQEQRRCVVWLDDLERFLGSDGLTVNMVDRLRGAGERDALVLATMRSAEFDRYSAREETGIVGAERDSWRDARGVLELATVVELRRTWSSEELERARAYTDSRIRAVLPKAGQLGVAELLAAGPELARDWRNAWRPSAHPRGAALVAAAVDCRRAGLHEPQPIDLLTRLAEQYLSDHGGALLRPESHTEALEWATASSHGASSLLLPTDRPEHYLALDYLFSAMAAACVPLAALDLVARKLPNVLVGAAYLGVLPLLALDAILNGPDQLVRAATCMAAAFAIHGLLYATGGIGGGDLKLVGLLAAALGWVSWTAAWTGIVAGWLIASVAVLAGKTFRREKHRPEVPLGLFLIIGTLTTALALATP